MTEIDCEDCSLRRRDCFRSLSADDLQFVRGMRRGHSELAAGRFLYKQGEPAKALYTLHEGWAGVFAAAPGEPPRLTSIFLPGELLGGPASIVGQYHRSVMALTRIRFCVLDGSLLEKMSRRGGALSFALLRELMMHRVEREGAMLRLAKGPPDHRLAYLFCDVFTRLRELGIASETMSPFPVSRPHLAQLVGLSEVHLARTLAEMRKSGLIELENKILYVRDEARLFAIAKQTRETTPRRLLLI